MCMPMHFVICLLDEYWLIDDKSQKWNLDFCVYLLITYNRKRNLWPSEPAVTACRRPWRRLWLGPIWWLIYVTDCLHTTSVYSHQFFALRSGDAADATNSARPATSTYAKPLDTWWRRKSAARYVVSVLERRKCNGDASVNSRHMTEGSLETRK